MIISLCLSGCAWQRQTISISSDNNRVLYAGIENPLTIAVDNISANKISAKSDNGTLTGENGRYNFYTDTGSVANFTLYKKGSTESIGIMTFYIRQLPDPTPLIGGYKGGDIPSAVLRAQAGIRTDRHYPYGRGLPVTSFTVSIIRNNNYVFREINNEGNMFNEEVQNAFKQLKGGDSIVINNIFAKRHDGTLTILSPLTFTIKNNL